MSWRVDLEEQEREEYEQRCEERAYEERRREEKQVEEYYEYYFSLDGWIDRMCNEFMQKYGDEK